MVIDLDRCNGCGACMVACAVENNVPPAQPAATERTGITWLRVFKVDNGQSFPEHRAAFVPMPCQQCGKEAPCVSVCPQNAVEMDQQTGIVTQVPVRCLGCRYCMAACPYHARYFNEIRRRSMDKHLIPRGVKRSPFGKFVLRMLPWLAMLGIGVYAI